MGSRTQTFFRELKILADTVTNDCKQLRTCVERRTPQHDLGEGYVLDLMSQMSENISSVEGTLLA
jgi:hypothetical protein